MTQVLFGQSYYLRFDPKEWQAMRPYPPLGSLYAASYVRKHGYTVGFFDSMLARSEAEWEEALDRHKPQFAVIYEDNFNYLSKMCLSRMRQAAFTMIGAAKRRGCSVFISGSDATDQRGSYFAAGADAIILGEGEITLVDMLDVLCGKTARPREEIAGVVWSGGSEPAARGFIKALDELPFPAWDLIDIERYKRMWLGRHGYYSMNMVTTRGCPYHCNWCAKPIYGQRYNVRSPENVAAELKWLRDHYQPDHIWFADDIFGLKPRWIEKFAAEVERLGIVTPFKCLLRVDLVKPGVPEALKRAGCEIVWVGAESGSQKILDAMDKGTRVEQIYAATRSLQAAGIKIGFFLQFGYPGEDRNDIDATLKMVRECKPDDIGISVSYPLPGTKFHANVFSQLGEKQNWLDSGDLAMMYRGPYSTEFYRQLHRVVHKEFRARKSAQRLKNVGSGASRGALRDAASLTVNWATLPLARRSLDKLAAQAQNGIMDLPRIMTPEAAATPSAQVD